MKIDLSPDDYLYLHMALIEAMTYNQYMITKHQDSPDSALILSCKTDIEKYKQLKEKLSNDPKSNT